MDVWLSKCFAIWIVVCIEIQKTSENNKTKRPVFSSRRLIFFVLGSQLLFCLSFFLCTVIGNIWDVKMTPMWKWRQPSPPASHFLAQTRCSLFVWSPLCVFALCVCLLHCVFVFLSLPLPLSHFRGKSPRGLSPILTLANPSHAWPSSSVRAAVTVTVRSGLWLVCFYFCLIHFIPGGLSFTKRGNGMNCEAWPVVFDHRCWQWHATKRVGWRGMISL